MLSEQYSTFVYVSRMLVGSSPGCRWPRKPKGARRFHEVHTLQSPVTQISLKCAQESRGTQRGPFGPQTASQEASKVCGARLLRHTKPQEKPLGLSGGPPKKPSHLPAAFRFEDCSQKLDLCDRNAEPQMNPRGIHKLQKVSILLCPSAILVS